MYYQLNYYYANRDNYLQKYREKKQCEICGCIVRFSSLNQHYKTKKCLHYKEFGYFPWDVKIVKPKKKNKKKQLTKNDLKLNFNKRVLTQDDLIVNFN